MLFAKLARSESNERQRQAMAQASTLPVSMIQDIGRLLKQLA